MSYTNNAGQPQGVAYSVTNRIREAMIAELDAVNGYAEHIANSDMAEINAAWHSIMADEKNHYGMFLRLLRRYDPDQFAKHQEDKGMKFGPKNALQAYKPQYDRQIILNNIREDIKGELEAVILYEQDIADIPCEEVRRVFYVISREEKGHLEHLTELLLKYDTDKYDALD